VYTGPHPSPPLKRLGKEPSEAMHTLPLTVRRDRRQQPATPPPFRTKSPHHPDIYISSFWWHTSAMGCTGWPRGRESEKASSDGIEPDNSRPRLLGAGARSAMVKHECSSTRPRPKWSSVHFRNISTLSDHFDYYMKECSADESRKNLYSE
jgi:hypothetical protein